ncbi:MAG: adenylate/guanylate cyclase domain-containing protein [Anaerolineae bacterium]|uniref:adenylate/guanylate cyclase domain-containing protein n=1 Tax=Promineifilum sp. TaxID=2664178 RepID=UPI001D539566|nr:adenylate/guanylate cyclase domain-containing protein [Anaerolineales bacterium]MCO5181666.1 adenylate/guanylate cyclase domain-containing protein [Promineifilum sp.]MCW5848190.1 adenylate/guanylate cyclase domain-containing protein [Anaerolineae bacterium]
MTTPTLALTQPTMMADRDQREQLQTDLLVTSSTIIALLGLLWGLIYTFVGAVSAGAIPIIYAAFSFASIGYFALTGRYHLFRFSQLLITLIFPALLMLVLGGFVNSSGVILWSLTSPVGALLFDSRRKAAFWFAGFAVTILTAGLIDAGVFGPRLLEQSSLSPNVLTTFFIMNVIGPSVVVFSLLTYFTRQRDRAHDLLVAEQAKSDTLLLNILPQSIARQLKDGREVIAECVNTASILFADIAGFTPLSAELGVERVVDLLNDLHTGFDEIMERHGLEKIRTIGDGYMAAAGVPTPRDDHAHAMVTAALEMLDFSRELSRTYEFPIHLRIGINTGTIMAGVIGRKKFSYDIWGDPVNVASRMESHGVADCIQVAERTYELIKNDFITEPRGLIEIKGKGEMRTWLVVGKK